MKMAFAILAVACLFLSGCGFANNMTGQVVRSVPNMVLTGGL